LAQKASLVLLVVRKVSKARKVSRVQLVAQRVKKV
jgi:hypothetical protein